MSGTYLGPLTRLLLLSDIYGCDSVGSSFWREDGSVVTLATGPHQRSYSRVPFSRDTRPCISVSDKRLPQPVGPDPHTYIPRNRIAQLYSQILGSLLVPSYDLHGYGGGIRTVSTRSLIATDNWSWLQNLGIDRVENVSTIIALFSLCRGNVLVCGAVT
jgi:hypothetical protein